MCSCILRPAILILLAWLWLPLAPLPGQDRDDAPLALSGFSLSEAFDFEDDRELETYDKTVERLLYRLMKSSPRSRDEMAAFSQNLTWDAPLEHPEEYRFWLFQREALLKRLEPIAIPDALPEAAVRTYWAAYAVADGPNGEPIPLVVLARNAPAKLPSGQELSERIRFSGLLYRRALPPTAAPPLDADSKWLVFVADRLEWLPENPEHASPSQVRLAQQGFDVGLVDVIASQNGKPLTKTDNEAFFQMLKAVDRTSRESAPAPDAIPLVTLLKSSTDEIGSYTELTAICRTCTPTEIPDEAVRQRLGIDRYYQLMLFPSLGQKVSVTEGDQQVTYDRYPVTVVCTALPPGLQPEDLQRKRVSLQGHFYRIWKYDSEIARQADFSGTVSPLIMAGPPQLVESAVELLDRWLLMFVVTVIFVFVALLLYLRRRNRLEPTRAETLLAELPDQLDTRGLD